MPSDADRAPVEEPRRAAPGGISPEPDPASRRGVLEGAGLPTLREVEHVREFLTGPGAWAVGWVTALPVHTRTLTLRLPARLLGRYRAALVVELTARGAPALGHPSPGPDARAARASAAEAAAARLDADRSRALGVRLGGLP